MNQNDDAPDRETDINEPLDELGPPNRAPDWSRYLKNYRPIPNSATFTTGPNLSERRTRKAA
jgi:hypothetical protein